MPTMCHDYTPVDKPSETEYMFEKSGGRTLNITSWSEGAEFRDRIHKNLLIRLFADQNLYTLDALFSDKYIK